MFVVFSLDFFDNWPPAWGHWFLEPCMRRKSYFHFFGGGAWGSKARFGSIFYPSESTSKNQRFFEPFKNLSKRRINRPLGARGTIFHEKVSAAPRRVQGVLNWKLNRSRNRRSRRGLSPPYPPAGSKTAPPKRKGRYPKSKGRYHYASKFRIIFFIDFWIPFFRLFPILLRFWLPFWSHVGSIFRPFFHNFFGHRFYIDF